jgi:hypothetical protein
MTSTVQTRESPGRSNRDGQSIWSSTRSGPVESRLQWTMERVWRAPGACSSARSHGDPSVSARTYLAERPGALGWQLGRGTAARGVHVSRATSKLLFCNMWCFWNLWNHSWVSIAENDDSVVRVVLGRYDEAAAIAQYGEACRPASLRRRLSSSTPSPTLGPVPTTT